GDMLILVVSSVITNHPFETVLLWTTDLEKSITRIKFYIIRTSGSSAEAFCDAHPWADHLAKLEVMVLTEQGLERAGLGLSQGEKFSVLLVYSAIAIATVFGFAASLIVGASFARLAALGILAYALGLRHGVDADHIVAIDNTTRKLLQDGQRPFTVGMWFSLGHSAVVFILTLALVFATRSIVAELPAVQSAGQIIGLAVSGTFLIIIGLVNVLIVVGIYRVFVELKA